MKREALAAQSRSHQGEQDRRGTDHGNDRYPSLMGQRNQGGARIGNRRAAGLGDQSKVVARESRGEQPG
jgi:hypothetical protein